MATPPQSQFHTPIVGDTVNFVSNISHWSKSLAKQAPVVRADIRGINGIASQTVYHLAGREAVKAFYDDENIIRGLIPLPNDEYFFDGSRNTTPKLNGESHRIRKGILVAAIHGHVDRFLEVSQSSTDKFIVDLKEEISNHKKKNSIKIPFGTHISRFVYGYSAKILYGHDADKEYLDTFSEVFKGILSLPINLSFTPYSKGLTLMKDWRHQWLSKRLAEHQEHPENYDDIVKWLIQAEPALTSQEIVYEISHLVFALGSLRGALSGALTLLLKSNHSEQLHKVRQELEKSSHLLASDRKLAVEDIETHLPYTINVIREALRIYPVAPIQLGTALKDFIADGYVVPRGHLVIVALYGSGFDETVYHEPEEFRPERFEHIQDIDSGYEYTPFGAGPVLVTHRCAGQRLIFAESAYILARLLAEFDISLVNPKQDFDFTKQFPVVRDELPVEIKIKS